MQVTRSRARASGSGAPEAPRPPARTKLPPLTHRLCAQPPRGSPRPGPWSLSPGARTRGRGTVTGLTGSTGRAPAARGDPPRSPADLDSADPSHTPVGTRVATASRTPSGAPLPMVRGHSSHHPTTPAAPARSLSERSKGPLGGWGERAAEQLRGHLIRDKGAPAGAEAR